MCNNVSFRIAIVLMLKFWLLLNFKLLDCMIKNIHCWIDLGIFVALLGLIKTHCIAKKEPLTPDWRYFQGCGRYSGNRWDQEEFLGCSKRLVGQRKWKQELLSLWHGSQKTTGGGRLLFLLREKFCKRKYRQKKGYFCAFQTIFHKSLGLPSKSKYWLSV